MDTDTMEGYDLAVELGYFIPNDGSSEDLPFLFNTAYLLALGEGAGTDTVDKVKKAVYTLTEHEVKYLCLDLGVIPAYHADRIGRYLEDWCRREVVDTLLSFIIDCKDLQNGESDD